MQYYTFRFVEGFQWFQGLLNVLFVILLIFWLISFFRKTYRAILILSILLVVFNIPFILLVPTFLRSVPMNGLIYILEFRFLLDLVCFILGVWGIIYCVRDKILTLRGEAVVDSWNRIIIQGAGKDTWVMDGVEHMMKDSNMPGVVAQQRDVSSGLFGSKRNFLVVTHNTMRDYKMYIGARDFGVHLDVSWYLTVEPRFLKRAVSKYTTGNPQALSMQIDFFSQQDLRAYTGVAHYCVTETVRQLLKELEQDPTGLNTKSKGFLELW